MDNLEEIEIEKISQIKNLDSNMILNVPEEIGDQLQKKTLKNFRKITTKKRKN